MSARRALWPAVAFLIAIAMITLAVQLHRPKAGREAPPADTLAGDAGPGSPASYSGGFNSLGGADAPVGAAAPRAASAAARIPTAVAAIVPTGRIEGLVLEKGGSPIAHASVRAVSSEGQKRAGQAESQADGAFVLALPPGRYDLEAEAKDHRPGTLEGLSVRDGEAVRGATFTLSAGARIFGTLADPDGKPVANAVVEVRGGGRGGGGRPDGRQAGGGPAVVGPGGAAIPFGPGGRRGGRTEGTACSDASGAYSIGGLDAGEKLVVARTERFPDPRPQQVTLVEEGQQRADFAFVRGKSISGTIRDGKGAGVAGVEVTASPEGGRGFGSGGGRGRRGGGPGGSDRHASSDAAGFYRVEGLADGRYTLTAKAEGLRTTERSGIAAGSDGVDFALEPGASISGRVVFQGGDAVPEASVSVSGPTSTDADAKDGAFTVSGLGAGRYTIEARVENVATGHAEVRLERGEQKSGVIVTVTPTRALRGRVVGPDRAPVAGALVTVSDLGQGGGGRGFGGGPFGGGFGGRGGMMDVRLLARLADAQASGGTPSLGDGEAVTGPDGSFSVSHVQSGRHIVRAVAAAYASGQAVVDVSADGDPPAVLVELPPAGSIQGNALDESQKPLGGARVMAMGTGGGRSADVSDDGSFTISGLAAGEYMVRLMAPPREPGGPPRGVSKTVSVVAGSPTELVIQIAPGPSVTGHLLKAGAPVADTGVMLIPTDGLPLPRVAATTGQDGSFRFDDVEPGGYQLRSGNAVASLAVAGAAVSLDLVIPSASVAGAVTDAQTGEPVDNAQVILYTPASPSANATIGSVIEQVFGRAQTAGDGRFRMDGVEGGTYSIRVSAPAFATARRDGITVAVPVDASSDSPSSAPIVVALDEGGAIAGRVLDPAGQPLAGARVSARNESLGIADLRAPSALTSQDGTFTVKALAAATYSLVATADGFAGTSTEIPFDGTALHIDLRVALGGALTVRVVTQSGIGMPDARVSLDTMPRGAAPAMSLTTDQTGVATYAHILGGSYAGNARLVTGGSFPFSIAVSEGGSIEARVVVPDPAAAPKR